MKTPPSPSSLLTHFDLFGFVLFKNDVPFLCVVCYCIGHTLHTSVQLVTHKRGNTVRREHKKDVCPYKVFTTSGIRSDSSKVCPNAIDIYVFGKFTAE